MKQIMIAIVLMGSGYCYAQTMQVCGVKNDKVCRLTANRKVSCYKTQYSENFKVCKNNSGYFICCETPNKYNSTRAEFVSAEKQPAGDYTYQNDNVMVVMQPRDEVAPQSQSYTVTSNNEYAGYYPVRGRIKVCYGGDNVAELNRAPYEGCPSPASEGPEVNQQRNLNVSNPEPMPPLAGQAY